MGDLRDWLRGINLWSNTPKRLRRTTSTWIILPNLDDRDLEQLVLSLGNRRWLLKAIAARNTEATPTSETRERNKEKIHGFLQTGGGRGGCSG
jgi:hypothetical protein